MQLFIPIHVQCLFLLVCITGIMLLEVDMCPCVCINEFGLRPNPLAQSLGQVKIMKDPNPLARSLGQVKLDSDKCKL